MASPCTTPTAEISAIDRMSGNDLSASFTMRYRKASDPDVDASYIAVTTTKVLVGITYPWLDITTLDPDTYVIHTYATSSGSTTGTKVTIVVDCEDVGT